MSVMNKLGQSILNMQDRIRTLEAELAQARADARVLAEWVRKALRQDDPDGLPCAGDDIHEALERNKP